MQRFIHYSLLLLLIPAFTFAAPIPPTAAVWFTPTNAKAKDEIQLNAFVYNSTDKSATITVLFSQGKTEIDSTIVSVAAETAKVATVKWKFPDAPATVTASVTLAIDANKRGIPELLGDIGSVTIGGTTSQAIIPPELGNSVKGWLARIFAWVEPWRIEQAQHFAALRDKSRKIIGITVGNDISTLVTPKPPEAPATPGEPAATDNNTYLSGSHINFGQYFVLIYAIGLATLFSSTILFYIAFVVVVLMVIRLIFRLFSH